MLLLRRCLAPLALGLVLSLVACGHQPDNPQKRGVTNGRILFVGKSHPAVADPLVAPTLPAPDVHGALLAVQAIWAHFPHPAPPAAPRPTRRRSAPTTASVPLQVVPQGQDYHRDGDWPIWSAIGRCEEPGAGTDGILWAQTGPTYVGGLGMARSSYDLGASISGSPVWHAGAVPEEQMEAARGIRSRYGLSAWGCGRRLFPGQ